MAGEGLPDNPRGWLIHVAARRMTDHVRAEIARRRREAVVLTHSPPLPGYAEPSSGAAGPAQPAEQDDSPILLFMCCHPALTPGSAIALTCVRCAATCPSAQAIVPPPWRTTGRARPRRPALRSGIT